MVVYLILVSIILVLSFYYLNGKYNEYYWKKRGVAFYSKNKNLGIVWDFLTTDKSLFEIMYENIYKKFPNEPAVGIGALTPTLYVKDPKNIQHIQQTDFPAFNHRGFEFPDQDLLADNITSMHGNRWKLMRQGMTPLFTTSKLKDMFYIIDKSATDFVDLIKNDPAILKKDMFNTFSTFCCAAIGAAVFGIKTTSVFDSPFLKMAQASVAATPSRNFKFALGSITPKALKYLRISVFNDYQQFFVSAIKEVIRQRKEEGVKKHDFADMCLILQKNGTLKDPDTGYEMEPTDELMAAQAFFFYSAGVDPTATSIYTTFIELGRNPDILQKVQDEIDQILEKYNGILTYDAVNEMEYLDKVFSESLRMYPPVGFLTRLCTRDSVLPVGNIKVSKGTKIMTSLFEMHHDPKYYPNPEQFNPERFAKDSKSKDVTYQPFGYGGRICIGMRYARLQAKAGLIHLLKEFSPKTTVLEGGIKYSKQQIQVRPTNVNLELIPRKVKSI